MRGKVSAAESWVVGAKGEGIGVNFPRMRAEGDMPNMWEKVRVRWAASAKSAACAASEMVLAEAMAFMARVSLRQSM